MSYNLKDLKQASYTERERVEGVGNITFPWWEGAFLGGTTERPSGQGGVREPNHTRSCGHGRVWILLYRET